MPGIGLGLRTRTSAAVPLHPQAVSWAETTSLSGEPLERLSGFLYDVDAAGIDLVYLCLGRSEFLARSGATHRAVIGPDATITGALTNATTGIVFDGDAGDVFEFNNPAPTTNGYVWQMAVAIPSANVTTAAALISGSVNSTGPYGPSVRTGNSPNGRAGSWAAGAAATTTLRNRSHAYAGASVGTPLLAGAQFTGSYNQPIKDIFPEFAFAQSGALWNNETKWRLGAQLTNQARFTGTISLALAGTGVLSRQQINQIAAAIVRHEIASINPPSWLGFVGDSMTVSASGGIDPAQGRSALWVTDTSGWKGSFYDIEAVGGTSITGQEGFFATMLARMAWAPDMPRVMVFWGGYNAGESGYTFNTEAQAEALADRYIAMAETCAAAGISTVHWSRTTEASVGDGGTVANNINHYNDYYKAAIEALDGNHIFYDHRVSYPGPAQGGAAGTHFDGPNRNAAYFGDDIHCSPTGISTLIADFLTQYPNPPGA